jgi:hypothetical protein
VAVVGSLQEEVVQESLKQWSGMRWLVALTIFKLEVVEGEEREQRETMETSLHLAESLRLVVVEADILL